MNFKKLGLFLLLAGIAIFIYGAIFWWINLPEDITVGGQTNLFAAMDQAQAEAMKTRNREQSSTIMMFGGISSLIGIAIRFAAKK